MSPLDMKSKLALGESFVVASCTTVHWSGAGKTAENLRVANAKSGRGGPDFSKQLRKVDGDKVGREEVARDTALDMQLGLLILLWDVPCPNGNVTMIEVVISIVEMFPMLAIT